MNYKEAEKFVVSVRLMTYNHAAFIEDALTGIDIQKTTFPIEVVVGDDFSVDGTLEKIQNYRFSNPHIHLKILNRRIDDEYFIKRAKKGRLFNFEDIVNNCSGKYIALLDGDDYWTDPSKLQKQVMFLEKNQKVNLCFHRAQLLQNNSFKIHDVPVLLRETTFRYKELLEYYNFIATASVMFRRSNPLIFPDWFNTLPFGDLGFYKIVSQEKFIACLNEVMCVYRIQEKGIWSGLNKRAGKKLYLEFYKKIYITLNRDEKKVIKRKAEKIIREIAKSKFHNSRLNQVVYYIYLKLNTIKLWNLN